MIVSQICYKSALNNVLDILTEEQIELVFSDLRILSVTPISCFSRDSNTFFNVENSNGGFSTEGNTLDGDSLSSIVKLPRCPEHLKEKYAIFLSKWFCGKKGGARDLWDRRGTSVYIRELREYVQYLPITEIFRLTESISRFMEKPYSDGTYYATEKEIKRAKAFLNFLLNSIVS